VWERAGVNTRAHVRGFGLGLKWFVDNYEESTADSEGKNRKQAETATSDEKTPK